MPTVLGPGGGLAAAFFVRAMVAPAIGSPLCPHRVSIGSYCPPTPIIYCTNRVGKRCVKYYYDPVDMAYEQGTMGTPGPAVGPAHGMGPASASTLRAPRETLQ